MGRPKQFDPDVAVERAMGVFWRKGYAATTPQDLVDEIGIGKGSLYNTFGSKHALFERALMRYRDSQAAWLEALLDHPGSAKDRVRGALEALVELDLGDPDRRGCMAVNTAAELAASDAEAAAAVRKMFARTESAFRATIKEGQRAGEIAADHDPAATAAWLLATVIGMRVLAKTAEDARQLRRVVDAAMGSL
ncbi:MULTISPECIES: TetR/AcrR family transcriptional regulator [unclassified Streptomyces]|uniref:TetR/AcrR family transcriptional regulator n=1 Tax=unclassified Streptomyces TaxID=2593676 RepID=UPI001368BC1A|nr:MULTISPECIES: TetR/AcrR family transcriptional regulator [unclassified Streptomyces]NEA04215.1 TetR/AcrR family transcriptional regulator [Streptomyces sp. SID10116]MYY80125.1 TetR family transcriptional regulator [Streptomyces sp. SID335]MYZ18415.1 TetR family transcriptional regulator [Streptomyces sp. SID337]NDZ85341.1 TetR/AcrR family transcriptional regulator [Streptomyces sp. SID10115]NEB46549.1 TetR/AcrR family transcriptional regulator [Streptomyces sp. SID339]